jgi:AcrR family transcriptional regulator
MARAPAKTAREPLTPERIEAAALELIERQGLAGFSTRELAGELHCEAMSIYHYFPSKGHLLDALVDRVVGEEMTVLEPHARDWRRRIEGVAREWRAIALKRPHFHAYLAVHRLNTPKALIWLNGIIGVFRQLGLGEETGVRTFRTFGYYIMGSLLDETAGYSRGPSTVDPVPDELLAAKYPNVAAAGKWFRPEQLEATFEHGLKVALDGIERELAATESGEGGQK